MKDNQKDSGVRRHTSCRVCGEQKLEQFLDLGKQPLANSLLKKDQLDEPEPRYPLRVLFCTNCNFVQLGEVVDPEMMFQNYVYHSSGMPASQHFRDYAESATKRFIESSDDLVVEIGSNDGHFLEVVKESGAKILGVDPARNIAKIAEERGIPTVTKYFNEDTAREIVEQHGQARLVVGNNVFAHIDNLHSVVKGVAKLLAPGGAFVIEVPYLVDMFENLTFDTIYHEHLSYLAIRPLIQLFQKYDMEVFDVGTNQIQGVSLRVFVGHKGEHEIKPSVRKFVEKELEMKLDEIETYFKLASRVEELKREVVDVVKAIKGEGKRIAAYGAPAKGNTLLNYFGIGNEEIDYAVEDLPAKVGLYTPGTHILIVDRETAKNDPPDYFLLLAWNYKDVIVRKVRDLYNKEGKFIMPVGEERVL